MPKPQCRRRRRRFRCGFRRECGRLGFILASDVPGGIIRRFRLRWELRLCIIRLIDQICSSRTRQYDWSGRVFRVDEGIIDLFGHFAMSIEDEPFGIV